MHCRILSASRIAPCYSFERTLFLVACSIHAVVCAREYASAVNDHRLRISGTIPLVMATVNFYVIKPKFGLDNRGSTGSESSRVLEPFNYQPFPDQDTQVIT